MIPHSAIRNPAIPGVLVVAARDEDAIVVHGDARGEGSLGQRRRDRVVRFEFGAGDGGQGLVGALPGDQPHVVDVGLLLPHGVLGVAHGTQALQLILVLVVFDLWISISLII